MRTLNPLVAATLFVPAVVSAQKSELDPTRYGATVGRLLTPGFILAAVAPSAFAALIDAAGPTAGMAFALILALSVSAAAAVLRRRFFRPKRSEGA